MRHMVRGFALALALLAALATAVPVAQAAPADQVALFVKAKLPQESVIGLLLLALSEELDKLQEALEALYEAGYISTASGGDRATARILAGVMALRYGQGASDDLMAAMMEYTKMVAREAREDRLSSGGRLVGATRRIASGLGDQERAQFSTDMRDWVGFLGRCVGGLKDAELEMIQMQGLVGQRQRVLQLTAKLIAAIEAAAKQTAGNGGGGAGAGSESGSLASGGGAGSAPDTGGCPPCGCSCP